MNGAAPVRLQTFVSSAVAVLALFLVLFRARIARLALPLLVLASSGAVADGFALDGAWRPAAPGEAVAAVERDHVFLQRFDPALLTRFDSPSGESWLRLRPASGLWPAEPWVLSVMGSGLQTVTVHMPGREQALKARFGRRDPGTWPGHGRLAFPVESPIASDAPLFVHLDARNVIPSSLRFAVQPSAEFVATDTRWLALASTSLAIMLAMATMTLCFALRLRDPTFLYYSVFITAYAFILALQGNYVFEPLGWSALASAPRLWGRLSVSIAIVSAVLFFIRFGDLSRHAPRGRRLLLGYAGLIATLAAAGVVPALDAIGRVLINPLLILGGPLFLGICIQAAWRGSHYARFFLLGWTPLLAVTAMSSLQQFGIARGWSWSDEAALIVGALEALILSLGLASRTLALRRAHEQARQQAEIDPLTGLYNRRAWHERLLELERRMRQAGAPLSVLFLDLDHFKRLNDQHGHEAGDAALRRLAEVMRAELRDGDIVGRHGGEEFVVALPGADSATAMRIAERIRERLQQPADADGIVSTVSIGAATIQAGEDVAQLLRRSDQAMYAAKKTGRNRVALADAIAMAADA